jgi:hypothetical protein
VGAVQKKSAAKRLLKAFNCATLSKAIGMGIQLFRRTSLILYFFASLKLPIF